VRAAGYGTNEKSQFQYWAALDDDRLWFKNCGVAGETTGEILGRLGACAKGADILVVQGGINDIAQAYGGGESERFAAVDEAAANLEKMVAQGQELGLEVEIANLLPWNNGHPYATPYVQLLNEEIDRIAAEKRVPLLPFHEVLEDPQNPDLMAPDWTSDGDHPSVEGYRRLGELAWRLP
jgi:lysophospholipase L1-like esterase